jgi:hypothetical protein
MSCKKKVVKIKNPQNQKIKRELSTRSGTTKHGFNLL